MQTTGQDRRPGAPGDGPWRREHDLLGEREVPASAYWGIHTLRALENFPVTGVPVGRHGALVRGLAAVKAAAARANRSCGALEPTVADAVVSSARELLAGRLHDQLVVDVVQGGAGTSTNMNVNEVVANRALETMGLPRGRYDVVHPVDHVNRSQSTNDVYPTAARLALLETGDGLLGALDQLAATTRRRAGELADVVKIGRTQLQEAVPMTVGQELGAFATSLEHARRSLRRALDELTEVHLGGTAVGTGLTAPAGYRDRVVGVLAEEVGRDLRAAPDPVEATSGTGAFVDLSAALRGLAVRLSKMSSDLRLLASGPRAGLAELHLPAVQAGSSIMPGKVNPVVPEVVNQIAFAVVGRDVTVSLAAEHGQLQLNAFGPVIVLSLLESVSQLDAGCRLLAERCVAGLEPDRARLRLDVERSSGLATLLVPLVGYERASRAAADVASGGVAALLAEHGLDLADVLQPDVAVGSRNASTGRPVQGEASSVLRTP